MPKKTKAVALKYNLEQDLAPVVIASGYGEVAERIINIAEERGIPVYRDDSAASMLCMLEVGASIPEELYQVVATVYIQIMETANKIKEGALANTAAAIGAPAAPRRTGGGRVFTPLDPGIDAGVLPDEGRSASMEDRRGIPDSPEITKASQTSQTSQTSQMSQMSQVGED
ncbi:MAG: EscU/YscU/HrcU family type III secretion system export apparatus switch protein [Peptococcaceae bacterium]|jgi:flagellar biosynthesis protein|nr:EscU/YscU/HrcU family type III secretion system export apparatus switch protein [Peptococcaceae bacterium]